MANNYYIKQQLRERQGSPTSTKTTKSKKKFSYYLVFSLLITSFVCSILGAASFVSMFL